MEYKSIEAQSTEELLRNTRDTNTAAKQQGLGGCQVVAGSMDITALYPSLDQETSARIVKEEF